MTLSGYLDAMNLDLVVRRYHNQGERWSASFEDCEVKEGVMLSSVYGSGHSPREAIEDYVGRVIGQLVVFQAGSLRRREFVVPKNIEIEGEVVI